MAKNKINPSDFLKPHLKGYTPEEVHLIQKGFKLGLQWAKEEIDYFVAEKEKELN